MIKYHELKWTFCVASCAKNKIILNTTQSYFGADFSHALLYFMRTLFQESQTAPAFGGEFLKSHQFSDNFPETFPWTLTIMAGEDSVEEQAESRKSLHNYFKIHSLPKNYSDVVFVL